MNIFSITDLFKEYIKNLNLNINLHSQSYSDKVHLTFSYNTKNYYFTIRQFSDASILLTKDDNINIKDFTNLNDIKAIFITILSIILNSVLDNSSSEKFNSIVENKIKEENKDKHVPKSHQIMLYLQKVDSSDKNIYKAAFYNVSTYFCTKEVKSVLGHMVKTVISFSDISLGDILDFSDGFGFMSPPTKLNNITINKAAVTDIDNNVLTDKFKVVAIKNGKTGQFQELNNGRT